MAITLVDINELASTISKNKDMLFVVEVPSGGGYIQRKVTKEVMFQLLGQNLDMTTTTDGGGVNNVITFDGASGNKMVYINNGTTGIMVFKIGSLGVSADGATNIIQMSDDGTLRIGTGATNGTLQMRDSGQFYEYSGKDLKQNVVVDLDIQNAATTEAVECRQSIAYLEVDSAGTIASHTIQFPATAKVGYTFEFYVQGTITALTLAGGAATVDEALTTVTNGGGKWVRVVTGGGIGVASWRRLDRSLEGIPLPGTEVGNPVTGMIEIGDDIIGFTQTSGKFTNNLWFQQGKGIVIEVIEEGISNTVLNLTSIGLEMAGGDIEITDPTKGIILTSPDLKRWRVTVDNTGTLVTTAL